MSNWMRRRIERSRARCDKAATTNKTDKNQEAGRRQPPTRATPRPRAADK